MRIRNEEKEKKIKEKKIKNIVKKQYFLSLNVYLMLYHFFPHDK